MVFWNHFHLHVNSCAQFTFKLSFGLSRCSKSVVVVVREILMRSLPLTKPNFYSSNDIYNLAKRKKSIPNKKNRSGFWAKSYDGP